jgi:hypothetical protein
MTTTDSLRSAIIAALKRRDHNANLWQLPTESDRALWSAVCRRVEVTAKGYGENADSDALRALAIACGLRDDGGDPADEAEILRAAMLKASARLGGEFDRNDYVDEDAIVCSLNTGIDEAEKREEALSAEVALLRAELVETERRLDAEISAMDARDGAYHALDGERDGLDDLVSLAEWRMNQRDRAVANIALLVSAVRRERSEREAWLASLPDGSCGNPPPVTLIDAESATSEALQAVERSMDEQEEKA